MNLNEGRKSDGYIKYFSTIKFMMILSGLWISPTKRYLNIKLLIFYSIMLSTGIYGLVNSLMENLNNIFAIVESTLYLSLYGIALHAYIHMSRNLVLLNRMFSAVESDFDSFEIKILRKETGIKCTTDANTRFLIRTVAASIAAAHIFRLPSTEVQNPYSQNKKPFFPFVLHFYSTDSLYYFYPMYILQFSISVIGALMNVLSIAVCVGFGNILSCEIDILNAAFEDARNPQIFANGFQEIEDKERDIKEMNFVNIFTEETEKENTFYEHLRKLVNQHMQLIQLKEDVQVVISPIAFSMFITSEFMLCFSSFQIYQMWMTSNEIDLPKMMDSISMLIGLICQQLVYFVYGQHLESKSTLLHQHIYYNNWYSASSKYISGISIICERTKQPFVLMAGNIIPINLNSFVTCMQASFSYFNLLRALSSK